MILLIAVTALMAYLIATTYLKARTLPPGPFPFPILGNLPQIIWVTVVGDGMLSAMENWRKTYGEVYTTWIGPLVTVNVCSHRLATETFVKTGAQYAKRFELFMLTEARSDMGIVFANGPHWLEQRRFSFHALRNLGLGKNVMEQRIMLELEYRLDGVDKQVLSNGGEFLLDPMNFIDLTIGNIINRILLTDRFTAAGEKKFFELKEALDDIITSSSFLDVFLSARTIHWPIFKQRYERLMKPNKELFDFFHEQIEQRKSDIASGKHELEGDGEDFVDAFLIEMNKSQEEGKQDSFTQKSLEVTLLDLWFAGQETTSNTLYWAFAYLLQNPRVLRKLEEELLVATDGSNVLKLADKTKTPYLNAVISETLRLSRIFPMSLWRETLEDTMIGDYLIPKGTAVSPQTALIMNDSTVFDDIETFNPDRFIDHTDEKLEQYIVAFGLGKRSCIGEALARAELYLVLGNFVRRYSLQASATAMPKMRAKDEMGGVRKAQNYQMIVKRRT